jgi:hypothetical protein
MSIILPTGEARQRSAAVGADLKEDEVNKGVANGYASLDSGGGARGAVANDCSGHGELSGNVERDDEHANDLPPRQQRIADIIM